MEPSSFILYSLAAGFAAGAAIAGVVVIGNVQVVRAAAYAYMTARLRVLRGISVGPRRWEELLRAGSLTDMAAPLDGTVYGPNLMPALSRNEMEVADRTLDDELARLRQRALDIIPVQDRGMGRLLGLRLELAAIKRVFRSIHAGAPAEGGALHPASTWSGRGPSFYEGLGRASSVEEAAHHVALELGVPLDAAIDAYKESQSLHELELALDRAWFATMDHAILPGSGLGLTILFEEMADVENLKMALRAAHRGVEPPAPVPGGALPEEVLEKAARADSLEVFAASLDGTAYGPLLGETLSGGPNAPLMEAALDKRLLSRARAVFEGSPFGLEAVLAFILEREYEVRDLRAVIRGTASGLERDAIKELMVGI